MKKAGLMQRQMSSASEKLEVKRAIVVEGRDDVDAVSRAAEALIIPTHGFGITRETWLEIEKADKALGLIILTDPDHAGEQIRKKIAERFPGALHAYVARDDAEDAGDIGIENAEPGTIKEALRKALEREAAGADADASAPGGSEKTYAAMSDLAALGLTGREGSAALRAAVCKSLGIGFGNAKAMVKKLKGFGIDLNELKKEVEKIGKGS